MYHGDAFRAASGGKAHFESVSLWLRSNGSDERQAKRRVKGRWRKNERRAALHRLALERSLDAFRADSATGTNFILGVAHRRKPCRQARFGRALE